MDEAEFDKIADEYRAMHAATFGSPARLPSTSPSTKAPTMRRRARDAEFAAVDVRYRIFFPHALRRLRPLEPSLTWLPLGAQYYVAARKAG